MSMTIKQFDIRVVRMDNPKQLPFDPFVQVIVDHWMHNQHEHAPIISAPLVTEAEIDEHFGNLIADLEALRAHARSALKLARARTNQLVASKKETEMKFG